MVHPVQVLFEVIETRPPLGRSRAVCPKTHVHHLGSTLGLFIVNAFLMTGKIIDGAKTVLARAIWHVAFEQLLVASLVFPVEVSFLPSQISNKKTYLLSEGHFPTQLHDGCSHRIEASVNCDGEPMNSEVYDGSDTDPYWGRSNEGPDSVDMFSVMSICGLEESTPYEEATTDWVAQLVPPYPESAE